MTEVAATKPDSNRPWPSKPPIRILRLGTTILGLGAAGLGIWGFFINIIHRANMSLSASSGWWRLIPISIGVALLGLLIPRILYFTAGLPLLAMGILFFYGPLYSLRGGPNLGYGFWMIAVGSGVLALAALAKASTYVAFSENHGHGADKTNVGETVDSEDDHGRIRRLPARAIALFGLIAGVAAFAGYFVNFFDRGGSALSSSNVGGWWFFVPISIGLGTLGLLIPRAVFLTSGLPLMALGLALAIRIYETTIRIPFPSLGYGFWMITVGSSIVVLAGWGLIALNVGRWRK